MELERNQTEDQADGPTNAVDDGPEPGFEERTVGALDNADISPDDHRRRQSVAQPVDNKAPAGHGEVIYNIKIDLPNDMGPMTINNDRLAANKGVVVVEYVNEEAKFEEAEAKDVDPEEAHAPTPSYSTS